MNTEEFDRFTLRVPSELNIELRVMAARNRRSLNAQIICMLEKCVDDALSANEKGEVTA